jgi:hypothetical protein
VAQADTAFRERSIFCVPQIRLFLHSHQPGCSQSSDILATLERLGALKMQGVLSDTELNTKKAELLGRL